MIGLKKTLRNFKKSVILIKFIRKCKINQEVCLAQLIVFLLMNKQTLITIKVSLILNYFSITESQKNIKLKCQNHLITQKEVVYAQ